MYRRYDIFSLIILFAVVACDKLTSGAHSAVKAQLLDPSSATFRNEEKNQDNTVVCGEVNAKNRMGGYVGYSRYIYEHSGIVIISNGEPDFSEYFRDTEHYNEYTSKNAYEKLLMRVHL